MKKINEVPGKVSFGQSFKDFFIGYVDFKGRTTRAGYWWMTLILILLSIVPFLLFVYFLITSAVSNSGMTTDSDIFNSMFGTVIIPLIIMLILSLALFLPSLAMAVRRYRDAGLRGRGFLVLWLISIASNYTEITSAFQKNSGSALFTFVTYIIGLFFFVLTVLPTNALTTKSNNGFIRFFLREKEEESFE